MHHRTHFATALVLSLTLAPMLILSGCAALDKHGDADMLKKLEARAGDHTLTPSQLAQKAATQANAGLNREALTSLEAALKKSPDDVELQVAKACVLTRLGRPDDALKMLDKVVQDEPGNGLALQYAGEAAFRAGVLGQAREFFEASLKADPHLWQSRVFLGVIHNHEGDHELAVARFSQALRSSPHNPEVLNNLGLSYLMLERWDLAVETLSQAIHMGHADPKTLNNLGLALARQGRLLEALDALKAAGDEATAYNNLGYVLFLQGDFQRSVEFFQKALEASPSFYRQANENLKRADMARRFGRPAAVRVTNLPDDASAPADMSRDVLDAEVRTPGTPPMAATPLPVQTDVPQTVGETVEADSPSTPGAVVPR